MKKQTKIFFKTFFISLICCAVFIGAGAAMLYSPPRAAQNEASSVPYYTAYPESVGVLFDIAGQKTFFDLDFERQLLSVVYNQDADLPEYGYSVDYRITADYSLVGDIIDMAGGIDYDNGKETLALTGVQAVELLSTTPDDGTLHRKITEGTLAAIAERGLTANDLLHIIEKSETDLTVPDCYSWPEYIKALCKGIRVVN
ncbi:MAG: hypothetical protein IKD04_02975 [Clostridia bacterium]|nr:hypothetical protein [Clostridia bacterium]